MAATNVPDRKVKARLLTLEALDQRTNAAKRMRELITNLEADLGGDLTIAQQELVRRAAALGAFIEDSEARWLKDEPVETGLWFAGVNIQRRLFESLGLQRVPKPVEDLRRMLIGEPDGSQ
jgi:hypothetical protein